MKNQTASKPLNDAELDRLGDLLESRGGDKAMNLEQLDGFFAALVAGPDAVMPSEYLAEVLGGEKSNLVPSGNSSPRLTRPPDGSSSACHQGVSDEQPCQRRRCHWSDQPAS